LVSFAVFSLVELPFYSVILLCLFSAIYTAIIGLLIYSGADDKVKGLTFAKGLNSLVLFAFTDLFALNWLTFVSWFFPPYWITKMIKAPDSFLVNCLALTIHVAWLAVLIFRYGRRES
jgi:hypothetical protein